MKQNNSNLLQHYFFVRCFALCVSLLFFVNISNAQKIKLYYDLKKDRVWVDGMKKMILNQSRKEYYYVKKGNIRLMEFFKNCVSLGSYYEELYKRRKIKSLKESIVIYEKITNYERFPSEGNYQKCLAFRNTLCRKLADIYFRGIGVKKDWTTSIYYALKGSSGINSFYDYYSMKYFENKNVVQYFEILTDTSFIITLNPFAMQSNEKFKKAISNKNLDSIAKKFIEFYKNNPNSKMSIVVSTLSNMAAQHYGYVFLDILKSKFVEKFSISSDLILVSNDIGLMPPGKVEFQFQKK